MRFQSLALVTALTLSFATSCSMIDNYTGEDVNKRDTNRPRRVRPAADGHSGER